MKLVRAALACFLAVASSLQARVERLEIISRADVLDGKPFGEAGAYEKVVGKVHFKVNPTDPHNALIVDLDKAERDAKNEVAFAADFCLLRPKEAARASGSVLLEIPNRGGKGILANMQGGKGTGDPTTEEEWRWISPAARGDGRLARVAVGCAGGLQHASALCARGAGWRKLQIPSRGGIRRARNT